MGDPRLDRVSRGGEGVPRRKDAYRPEAPPAASDDERVEFLLRACPEYDARRWVQQMVGWARKAAEYKARVRDLEARLADAEEERDRWEQCAEERLLHIQTAERRAQRLEEEAATLVGQVGSFLSSLPFIAPEALAFQAHVKLEVPLSEFERALAGEER